MTLANAVQTSTGDEKTNLFISLDFHVSELLSTGKVQVDLRFYNSEETKNTGADAVYAYGARIIAPIDETAEETIVTEKVTNCTIQCSPNDIIKASGQSKLSDVIAYFYSKVKSKLEGTYNWTITL